MRVLTDGFVPCETFPEVNHIFTNRNYHKPLWGGRGAGAMAERFGWCFVVILQNTHVVSFGFVVCRFAE